MKLEKNTVRYCEHTKSLLYVLVRLGLWKREEFAREKAKVNGWPPHTFTNIHYPREES
jgi:hypothetical protein